MFSCAVADKKEVAQPATSKSKAIALVGFIAIVTIGVAVGVGLLVSKYVEDSILLRIKVTLCFSKVIVVPNYFTVSD